MDLPTFQTSVRDALDAARDSLGRIEQQVREVGDDPRLMQASRVYAEFCMHARDFMSSVHMGRPLPRRFGERVTDLQKRLEPLNDAVAGMNLHPSVAELSELVASANVLPQRI